MDPAMRGETIVAIATASGVAGLAVVRVSGHDALAVARRVVSPDVLADPVTSHRARLAMVVWPTGAPAPSGIVAGQELDQVLVLPLLAPHSYTGEDTVEFSCHGGALLAQLVCDACRAAGARAAGPGEFTRRAFLHGRLSLAEAEAVADLVDADHVAGARAALAQLRGGLDRELVSLMEPLRVLLAELEGALEFGDDDDPGPDGNRIAADVSGVLSRMRSLLRLGPASHRLREGVHVVLAGAVNAGKSSLFNALVGEDRVIVDAEPGTTRDVVAARVVRDGLLYVLHDTAGLHAQPARLEHLGMVRTQAAVAQADIVFHVRPADGDGRDEVAVPAGVVAVSVVSKADLAPLPTWAPEDHVAVSSLTGQGLDALWSRLATTAVASDARETAARGLLLNARHEDRLRGCVEQLEALLADVARGVVAAELVATALRGALLELDEISGRVFSERLLGDVFARFCVGK